MQVLINLGNEVNVKCLDFAKKLGLLIQNTNINAQKIDGSILNTFGIVIVFIYKEDKK